MREKVQSTVVLIALAVADCGFLTNTHIHTHTHTDGCTREIERKKTRRKKKKPHYTTLFPWPIRGKDTGIRQGGLGIDHLSSGKSWVGRAGR
ncbi:hypothetical protein BJ166DRAFT_544211 [Pestalotiopsis sp. NC0098]|nr:hypothetical protein BJ166DRAFT_544211 [Pestalotiopsis sp. NC0098]